MRVFVHNIDIEPQPTSSPSMMAELFNAILSHTIFYPNYYKDFSEEIAVVNDVIKLIARNALIVYLHGTKLISIVFASQHRRTVFFIKQSKIKFCLHKKDYCKIFIPHDISFLTGALGFEINGNNFQTKTIYGIVSEVKYIQTTGIVSKANYIQTDIPVTNLSIFIYIIFQSRQIIVLQVSYIG